MKESGLAMCARSTSTGEQARISAPYGQREEFSAWRSVPATKTRAAKEDSAATKRAMK